MVYMKKACTGYLAALFFYIDDIVTSELNVPCFNVQIKTLGPGGKTALLQMCLQLKKKSIQYRKNWIFFGMPKQYTHTHTHRYTVHTYTIHMSRTFQKFICRANTASFYTTIDTFDIRFWIIIKNKFHLFRSGYFTVTDYSRCYLYFTRKSRASRCPKWQLYSRMTSERRRRSRDSSPLASFTVKSNMANIAGPTRRWRRHYLT